MRDFNSRNGSALLIVIGMLAFLIVSAVGFSAYMRYARLPSSYLRRSASSRQLVKAAMAEAIDSLDKAINNNPHPGIGSQSVDGTLRNVWRNRVLIGTDSWSENDANWDDTVSPLCLEALAYIPPTLVNEARYYSRQSPTAKWKSFDFDIGRYAFCVLDVSDYFDVNRMFAGTRRSSASNQRISLSYIFEDGARHTGVGSGADGWDTFMEDFRDVDSKTREISFESKYPLISVADFNLALGRKGSIGKMKSPFVEYVNSSGSRNGFYDIGKNGNEAADDMVSRMTFVTDGLFPKTEEKSVTSAGADSGGTTSVKVYDLADSTAQPFKLETLSLPESAPSTLMNVLTDRGIIQGEAKKDWVEFVGQIGMVALYDYLDADRVPLSLAIPTVERVPMICGIQPDIRNLKFAVRKETEPTASETSSEGYPVEYIVSETKDVERTVRKIVRYKIDNSKFGQGLMGSGVKALTVFPFPRKDEKDGSFKVDGQLKFFFSSEEMRLRTGTGGNNTEDVLHIEKDVSETGHDDKTGVTSIKLVSQTDITPKKVNELADAVQRHDFPLGGEVPKVADSYNNNPLLTVEYQWKQTPQKDQSGRTIGWTPSLENLVSGNSEELVKSINSVSTAFPPVKANGAKDEAFANSEGLKQMISQSQGKTLHYNCALWFRVKDADGKVVDMVPACTQDDVKQNSATVMPMLSEIVPGDCAYPLLRFETGFSFEFSIAGLERLCTEGDKSDITLVPNAAMVADPRYNHSPEDWFAASAEGELTETAWLNSNKTGDNGRDRDIFMATSDAGYLQSIYELAFLPRTKTPGNGSPVADLLKNDRDNSRTSIASNFEETRNHAVAWRTFDPFDNVDAAAFDRLPIVNDGSGFKVNPYSDSTNVMMSVFANTPLDWRCASTNVTENGVDFSSMDLQTFNKTYAFNAYSSEAKLEWNDLTRIAGRFMDRMKSAGSGKDWEDVWRTEMAWRDGGNGEGRTLCGFELESNIRLWDVDRKYLYGFWKECFAVKQQMFLVFVRAEPMMMGSGASGHMPPQLGGKAMALVWRDPVGKSNDPKVPHKTRVLFYRQFD